MKRIMNAMCLAEEAMEHQPFEGLYDRVSRINQKGRKLHIGETTRDNSLLEAFGWQGYFIVGPIAYRSVSRGIKTLRSSMTSQRQTLT
jgi:hypothetical protein